VTPIITEGQLVSPESHWNDPSVLYENGGWTMYASCCPSWVTMDIHIYRLRSTDRVNWTLSPSTPVLMHGAAGTWDQKAVETPSVVKFNGGYHMFYTGYPGDYSASKEYKIGHATSTDGITWTKDASFFLGPTAPTNATATMDFRQYVCAEPGAVVVGNKLHVYFTAIGGVAQVGSDIQSIGVTILDPATGNWSAPKIALLPDQTLYPRSTYYGFSTPAAGVVDGQVVLGYSIVTASPWKQVAVGNATSSDGLTGWRYNQFPVIGRDQAWRSNECRAPAILQDPTGTHMFFAGDDGARLSIGYKKLA
jgi:predicted GH43/DUF377 family glycosyl hydrolase